MWINVNNVNKKIKIKILFIYLLLVKYGYILVFHDYIIFIPNHVYNNSQKCLNKWYYYVENNFFNFKIFWGAGGEA